MAEARADEDEERMREPGGPRRSTEHPDRNKPDQRHSSQGPLSSIRAVIKRTSARTTSQSEHHRDRRRPEITILSAEPLPSVVPAWFSGASGSFPPAPPPAPPSWAAGSTTIQLPPPSYEQVIREKSREQTHPSPSSSSHRRRLLRAPPPPSPRRPTRTLPDPYPDLPKPPRPSFPLSRTPVHGQTHSQSAQEERGTQASFHDIITEATPPEAMASPPIDTPARERPKPRPRSRVAPPPPLTDQPMASEVKVQTLVRLKDDAAARECDGDDAAWNTSTYLQDLLEAFGFDEPQPRDDLEDERETFSRDPEERVIRPQPRPRTHKPKPQTPLDLESEALGSTHPAEDAKPCETSSSPPTPAPRLLQSPGDGATPSPSTKPAGVPPVHQGAAASSGFTEKSAEGQADAPSVAPEMTARKRSSVPKHLRPPPPINRKLASASPAAAHEAESSVPPLPPRPSSGRLLPLRPPPMKGTKPASSAPSPSSASQLVGSRVPKRGPPLPPRPKPGHLLYHKYPEDQELIVLDDTKISQAPVSRRVARFEFEGEEFPLEDDEDEAEDDEDEADDDEDEAGGRKRAAELPAAGSKVTGRTLYDFSPECDDELCLKTGDVVLDLEAVDADWFLGDFDGKRGMVPKNHIQVLSDP